MPQDADLEYDLEYNTLAKPMVEGYADVVFRTRFWGKRIVSCSFGIPLAIQCSRFL